MKSTSNREKERMAEKSTDVPYNHPQFHISSPPLFQISVTAKLYKHRDTVLNEPDPSLLEGKALCLSLHFFSLIGHIQLNKDDSM